MAPITQPAPTRGATSTTSWPTIIICWLLVIADGYDLIVFGAVKASLIAEWNLTQGTAGLLGSSAFLGMLIGSLIAGRISDRLGRKRATIWCAILFTIPTVLCAAAPNPETFALLRLTAGIGMGGLIPAASALAADVSPRTWRSAISTLMFSGVPLGGITASLLGIPVIPHTLLGIDGWRWMFIFPLIVLLLLVPAAYRLIPAEQDAAPASAKRTQGTVPGGFRQIFSPRYLTITITAALAALAILFTWFGLGADLPYLMKLRGAELGSALTFSLVLNIGAVTGSILTAWAGDRYGPAPTAAVASALASTGLFIIMATPASNTALIYAMLVLAGIGTHGTLALIISAVTLTYEDAVRGTALGLVLGVGRVGAIAAPQVAGLILGAGSTPQDGVVPVFTAFATAAALAALLLAVLSLLLRKKPTP